SGFAAWMGLLSSLDLPTWLPCRMISPVARLYHLSLFSSIVFVATHLGGASQLERGFCKASTCGKIGELEE
ncbi:MAG: hypothetical protein SVX38_01270, partial [Chloroflexota bacterium]|nr:hypothetical protein [Chloroflexota bacterium]